MSGCKDLTNTIFCRPPIFVVILIFIAAALILSSYSKYYAFALKKGPIECSTGLRYSPYSIVAKCCQTETDDEGIEINWCTFCEKMNPPSDCGPRFQDKENPPVPPKLPPPVVSTQPPSVAPAPKLCPDGSSPDANGKCPPTTQAPTDQGTTLPPPEKHKGSNLGQLGGSLLNNNNSPSSQTTNNTSSKHPKGGNNALQAPPIDQGPS